MGELTAIYVRVSTQEQAAEGYSVSEQTERASKYCQAMNWSVYKVYTDAGFSGANTNRPALKQLIKDVETGKLNRVLVYKLDRLSRSQKDTLQLIEDTFLANSVDFVSMTENFDTATPFGRAMVGILAVFAQLEREQIRERLTMGKQARANLGLYSAGKPPIGYDYIPGTKDTPATLKVNEFERLQIEKIFSDYASGKTPRTIAKELNDAGMLSRYGRWCNATIRTLLPKKTYIGYISYDGIWHKGTHEPIISEKLFDECQLLREKKQADYAFLRRRNSSASSYLSGLLICGHCGRKYSRITSSHKQKHTYEYYCCTEQSHPDKKSRVECHNPRWQVAKLDSIIFGELKKLAFEPITPTNDNDNTSKETDIITAEIEKIDGQLSRLIDLFAVGGMPLDTLNKRVEALNEQKTALAAELDKLQNAAKSKLPPETAEKYIATFSDVLDNGDFEQIRLYLTTLIDKIVLDGENITIHWNFV